MTKIYYVLAQGPAYQVSTNSVIARDFQELLATMTQFSRHLSTIMKITFQVLPVFLPTRKKKLQLN